MKVDMLSGVEEAWVTDWYECPSCGSESIERSFLYCPYCQVMLEWEDEEEAES
ncbi:hypothetical protein [Paenibacillus alvei]|nr:hypothetical protein [Paenibacillus alvei]EJW14752.1 hypothetical protein PAV_11c00930 [Paenibacillus alvei DSM 29]MCY9539209.1 hypothetical protein [Paenibacillus alvei]MEC0084460.1 hypothetical protein [Paenibacillus alvei]NEZ45581.1 hypothetical protein [Paenibacillus alvei]